MNIIKLEKDKIKMLYDSYMVKDFPAEEIRPWSNLKMLIDNNNYLGYAFYDDEQCSNLLAYCLFVINTESNVILLDFFAVNSTQRGSGIGSKILKEIKEICKKYSCALLEVENPKFAKDDDDLTMRNRRISFYTRNGVNMTNVTSTVMGAHFSVMYIETKEEKSDEDIKNALESLYTVMFVNGEDKNIMINNR